MHLRQAVLCRRAPEGSSARRGRQGEHLDRRGNDGREEDAEGQAVRKGLLMKRTLALIETESRCRRRSCAAAGSAAARRSGGGVRGENPPRVEPTVIGRWAAAPTGFARKPARSTEMRTPRVGERGVGGDWAPRGLEAKRRSASKAPPSGDARRRARPRRMKRRAARRHRLDREPRTSNERKRASGQPVQGGSGRG